MIFFLFCFAIFEFYTLVARYYLFHSIFGHITRMILATATEKDYSLLTTTMAMMIQQTRT